MLAIQLVSLQQSLSMWISVRLSSLSGHEPLTVSRELVNSTYFSSHANVPRCLVIVARPRLPPRPGRGLQRTAACCLLWLLRLLSRLCLRYKWMRPVEAECRMTAESFWNAKCWTQGQKATLCSSGLWGTACFGPCRQPRRTAFWRCWFCVVLMFGQERCFNGTGKRTCRSHD